MFNFWKKKRKAETNPTEKQEVNKDGECQHGILATKELQRNVNTIKERFNDDETLKIRYIENQFNKNIKCCLIYSDGLVNNQIINDDIVKPLQKTELSDQDNMIEIISSKVIRINEVDQTNDVENIIEAIAYGDTVLLLDGNDNALILNTKGFVIRSSGEPDAEKILRGPREGFVEAILINLSMVRRRIRSSDLKMEFKTIGSRTKTKACICYMRGIAKQEVIDELHKRLDNIELDGVLDSNYINECIRDAEVTPFETIGNTERPDVVVAKLLEGRIALFVDGTPVVLTLPHLFIESFQSPEDYYVNYYFASISRILRIIGFFVTISIPALYIAIVDFHQEMLPTPLLMSITAARQDVPFPSVLECVGMVIIFEILRETGIRMPSSLGQALSIVGALVLGQAAVQAKIVSAPIIIVISITGITGLIVPRLMGAITITRFFLLAMASMLGLYGYVLGMMGLLIHLVSLRSFGIPILNSITTFNFQRTKDIYVRAPWTSMLTRPKLITENLFRMKGAPKQ